MPLPPPAQDWMNRADIDYIGPFVKAWAAFNAWYRHASQQARERAMLDFVKTQPNPVRRRVLPLLEDGNNTAEGLSLKQAICDLQLTLDDIQFEITKKGVVERVSLRTVCINPKNLNNERIERSGQEFKAAKIQGGAIEVGVTSLRTRQTKFLHTQDQYDPNEVYAQADFGNNLSLAQQTTLRQFYDGCNPRPMTDLVQGGGPQIAIGTIHFQCTPEELLGGLIETIYTMRNALLHGEVDPDANILACYEPAYRIVMKFLNSIR